MTQKATLVWFRNDLRIHDHEALSKAAAKGKVLPFYCFDVRQFSNTPQGFPKTGAFRAKFLLESVQNLRENLKILGADLIIRIGKPEEIIPELVKTHQLSDVYASQEVTAEEKKVEDAVESMLWKQGVNLNLFWQSTLFHLEDLPFPIPYLPESFTEFRKFTEKQVWVRKCFDSPQKISMIENINTGKLPSIKELGLDPVDVSKKAVLNFEGGEDAAWNRLTKYIWQSNALEYYKETRNGLLGADYSSKFSPWLALGCISPRRIFEEVKRYEKERIENDSTYWLIFELLWRDYFRFVAKKHGSKLFQVNGFKKKAPEILDNLERFKVWTQGKTGIPFIDANMRELSETGYMSNRGRQNVASLLINDLQLNWTWGAAYFESMLIDYDVCSNWGNWCYLAGVGNDPRQDRYFNILSQARKYDPQGDYVRYWIPELQAIQGFKIHHPTLLTKNECEELDFTLGKNYPDSVVSIEKWVY